MGLLLPPLLLRATPAIKVEIDVPVLAPTDMVIVLVDRADRACWCAKILTHYDIDLAPDLDGSSF
jgi:hypothetical protein